MQNMKELSEEESENLRLENDILKIKLNAEYGMKSGNTCADLDPQIENDFLRYIENFEKSYADCKTITVAEKLGNPVYLNPDTMDDDEFKREIRRFMELLEKNNLVLNVNYGPYPDSDIYRFIVEELLPLEIDDINVAGMRTNFIYEEFHPNHEADINNRCVEFLACWFKREFTEYHPSLSELLLSPGGQKISKEQVYKKLHNFFSAFTAFEKVNYTIDKIQFDEVGDPGNLDMLGFAEGYVSYEAVLENGESTCFNDRFKIFVSRRWDWWSINTFIMPGFVW